MDDCLDNLLSIDVDFVRGVARLLEVLFGFITFDSATVARSGWANRQRRDA